jgi:hypothetical protein
MSCELSHEDAAYVLGALSPAERQHFERHLPGCADCSSAVRDLAGMPGLLSRLDLETVESLPVMEPVPDTLLPALLREVRRSRRRHFGLVATGSAAAAAAVAVLSLGVTGNLGGSADGPGSGNPATVSLSAGRPMTQVGQHLLTARIGFQDVAWGTRLDLRCRYHVAPGSYRSGEPPTYALVVHTQEGKTEQVATWRAVPGRTTTLTAATAAQRDDIASVEVRTLTGRTVLQLAS